MINKILSNSNELLIWRHYICHLIFPTQSLSYNLQSEIAAFWLGHYNVIHPYIRALSSKIRDDWGFYGSDDSYAFTLQWYWNDSQWKRFISLYIERGKSQICPLWSYIFFLAYAEKDTYAQSFRYRNTLTVYKSKA